MSAFKYLKIVLILFYVCVLSACIYVYHVHACLASMKAKRGQIPWDCSYMVVSHHVCGCQKLNPGPLVEQPVLLNAEPFLQLQCLIF